MSSIRKLAEKAVSQIKPHNEYTGIPSDDQIVDAIETVAETVLKQEREEIIQYLNAILSSKNRSGTVVGTGTLELTRNWLIKRGENK